MSVPSGVAQRTKSADMVFETFFGLMGVESNYIDKRFDLTSPQYQMELENMSTAWGKVRLQDTL